MGAAVRPWPVLGALLVREGLVGKAELESVLARQRISGEQRISGQRLGELLVERGVVTHVQLAQVLAEQFELPYVELDGSEVDLQVARLLPAELARRFSALPMSKLPDGSVLVAVADPTSVLFSEELRRALGAPFRFAVAAPEKVEAAIAFAHQRTGVEVDAREGAGPRAAESRQEPEPARPAHRSPASSALGALLIRDRLVSEEELEAALAEQRVSSGTQLGEILVASGAVTRTQVARLVAEQYELPFVELRELDPEQRKAAARMREEIARRYSALPIRVFPDGSLLVVVSDPKTALYADELRLGVEVPLQFAVAAPDALAAAISTAYRPAADDDDAGATHQEAAIGGPDTSLLEEHREVPLNGDVDRPVSEARALDIVLLGAAAAVTDADSSDAERPELDLGDQPGTTAEPMERAALASIEEAVESEAHEEPTTGALDESVDFSETDLEEAIGNALSQGASDIHFTPQPHGVVVRARIDGVMRELGTITSVKQAQLATRLKLLGRLDTDVWRAPQDGCVVLRRGEDIVHLRIDMLPTTHGEKATLHVLHQGSRPESLADLGLSPESEEALRRALLQPSGLILACGPVGCGSTTTLYAALRELNTPERALTTVEDPIEHVIPGVDQTEVDPVAGLMFEEGLRAILHSDSDVILVGEIRDSETAQLAVRAALSGRLVLAALHAQSAAAAVERLTDMGVEPGLLGATLTCVVAQRLARRICQDCRESYYATAADLAALGRPPEELRGRLLARGRGCAACGDTGYRGRVAFFELLLLGRETRELVARGASSALIGRAAIASGMRTLRDDGIRLCLEGVTTAAEVRRVAGDQYDKGRDSGAL